MNPPLIFLTVDEVLAIHQRMIAEFGGRDGVGNRGLLESAAAMPAAQFAGQHLHEGVPAMAAAYLFHLAKNHPFMDGNKRAALVASEVFLLLNGYELQATNEELEQLTLGVAEGSLSKEQATSFFRSRAQAREGEGP